MAHLSDPVTAPGPARPSTAAPSLSVERLTIRHRRAIVLRDFSWSHSAGRVAWVVGENGAGKSSLLRVLAGRAPPSTGSVRIHAPPPRAAHTLYYHPDMGTPRHATVGEWRRWTRTLPSHADEAAPARRLTPDDVAVGHRLDRLSTGQAKRFLLDALLRQPAALVVLDEPFAHLSDDARDRLTATLVARAHGSVVVVATNRGVPGRAGASRDVIALDGGVEARVRSEATP